MTVAESTPSRSSVERYEKVGWKAFGGFMRPKSGGGCLYVEFWGLFLNIPFVFKGASFKELGRGS